MREHLSDDEPNINHTIAHTNETTETFPMYGDTKWMKTDVGFDACEFVCAWILVVMLS